MPTFVALGGVQNRVNLQDGMNSRKVRPVIGVWLQLYLIQPVVTVDNGLRRAAHHHGSLGPASEREELLWRGLRLSFGSRSVTQERLRRKDHLCFIKARSKQTNHHGFGDASLGRLYTLHDLLR